MTEDIYRRYGPALVRKAARVLGNRSDAEDVVHALFVQLFQASKSKVDMAYLFSAITHRCLNLLRDERRQGLLRERQQLGLRGPTRTRCDERAVDFDLLVKLLRRFDDKVLGVVVAHYYDDLSQEEVALVTGLSRKTVGKYLKRVREELVALSQEVPA